MLNGGLDEVEDRRFQHYEVELSADGRQWRELGRGAMGITYRAIDLNLGAPVALKVISARYSGQSEARRRFHEEARTAARLRHPNVASVFHFGETPGGDCFYAMELVEGETLEDRVRREVSLGANVVLEIALQVARALVAAEKHGLVHRDLKPSNLLLVPNEQSSAEDFLVKVIDFGLARTIGQPGAAEQQSSFSGTPGFASPEQTNPGAGAVDARSDIYSLGATLRYALTGRPPPPEVAVGPLQLEDLERRDVPAPLIALLRFMIAFDPADRPQTAQDLLPAIEKCRCQVAAPRRGRWLAAAPALLAIAVLGAGFGLTRYFSKTARAEEQAPTEKSIAVLPFENLSDNKENASFAAGVQDEILSALAKVAGLKVISRTSAMQYGANQPRNVREIARSLGVRNVVEGSVQRIGNRVRVITQLIDAQKDTHLWSQTYDRDVSNTFAVEDEVAEKIAAQLKTKLSPAERAAIAEQPTDDLEAYQLYTEATSIFIWHDVQNADKSLTHKLELLAEATQRDPRFALAYCAIAKAQCDFFQDDGGVHLVLAKKAAETASQLRPDLGESHLALALPDMFAGDYDQAQKEITLALRTLPNNAEAFRVASLIDQYRGRWDDAIAKMQKAHELDPKNEEVFHYLRGVYMSTRRYRECEQLLRQRVPRNQQEEYWIQLGLAKVKLFAGDAGAAQAAIDQVPLDFNPTGEFNAMRYKTAFYRRDYSAVERIIATTPKEWDSGFYAGILARLRGDQPAAHAIFVALRKKTEATDFRTLATIDAALGRKDEAIREAQQAITLTPLAKNALDAPGCIAELGLVYAWVGERDKAIEQLQNVVKLPCGITYGELLLDPNWDPLRGDPRFSRIIAEAKPKG
ncbi:MAG: protein kinase [Chthoniobacterales bacterium]